jgi:hypothetical protein
MIQRDNAWLEKHARNALAAEMVLRHVVDESRVWQRVFNSEDDRIVLDAMKFLVSMRDGRPAQRINVTSTQLTLNASELDRARAIVAEIRYSAPLISTGGLNYSESLAHATPRLGTGTASPLAVDVTSADGSNNVTPSIMLSSDGGAKKGGM